MRFLTKIFWRFILPLILAALLTVIWLLDFAGRASRSFFGYGSGLGWRIFLFGDVAFFLIVFAIYLRITLNAAKEAEGYEERLKEAKRAEEEYRRRASWTER